MVCVPCLLGEQAPPPKPVPTITVPLAAADLPEGRRLTLSDIALHSMTTDQLSQKAKELNVSVTEVMLGTEFLMGRTLRQPVTKDAAFLTSALYLEGTGENIAESLQAGERAVTVEVAKRRGGNLSVGTMVDVVFRSEAQPESDTQLAIPETTMTLFEGVRIVAVEKPDSSKGSGSHNLDLRLTNGQFLNMPKPQPLVTLAVNLSQANILQTVEGRGELTLVPRAAEEATDVLGSGTQQKLTLGELLEVKEEKPFQTEIYRAGSRQAKQFDENGVIDLAQ